MLPQALKNKRAFQNNKYANKLAKNKKVVIGGWNLEVKLIRLGRINVSSKECHMYQILKEGSD